MYRFIHTSVGSLVLKSKEGKNSVTLRSVTMTDVIFLGSFGEKTTVFLDLETLVIDQVFDDVVDFLDKEMFFKCHNLFAVNTKMIMRLKGKKDIALIMKNDAEIPVSSRRLKAFRDFYNG